MPLSPTLPCIKVYPLSQSRHSDCPLRNNTNGQKTVYLVYLKTVAKALRTPGEPVRQLVSLLLPLSFGNSFWLCGEKCLITHHEQEGAWLSVALHNLALHVVCVCYHSAWLSATQFTHPQFFSNSVIFCTNTENARMKRQVCSQGAYSTGAKGQVTSKQASSSDAVRKAQKLWGHARVMVPAEERQGNLPRSTSAPRPRTVSEGGRADIVPRRRHS